jgi:hypothetical protein
MTPWGKGDLILLELLFLKAYGRIDSSHIMLSKEVGA